MKKEDIQKRMIIPIILWVVALIIDIAAIVLYNINYVSLSEFIMLMICSVWIAVIAKVYRDYLLKTMQLIDIKNGRDREDEEA